MPVELQEIILDLEHNYGIIERINTGIYSGINSGIILSRDISNSIEGKILAKYDEKTQSKVNKFLKQIIGILRGKSRSRDIKHVWLKYSYLNRLFTNCFDTAPIIVGTSTSTATKKIQDTKKRETSGDSFHSSSSKEVLRVEEAKVERVKNTPLGGLVEDILKPLKEMNVYISPNTVIHAIRLMHLFGFDPDDLSKTKERVEQEETLYAKIIDHLHPNFSKNKFGWAWPELFIDQDTKRKAHFSIQMHKNGRFILPTKRGMNLVEFFEEFDKVFHFLTPGEIEFLLNSLKFWDKEEDHPFVHLANEIGPQKNVEEHLDKAKIRLRWIDHLGVRECIAKVDRSFGRYEVEIEGRIPESYNLNQMLAIPQIIVGSFQEIASTTNHVLDGVNSLKQGQSIIHQRNGETNSLVQNVASEFFQFGTTLQELIVLGEQNHGNLKGHLSKAIEGFAETARGINQELNDMKAFVWNNTEKVINEQREFSEKITKFSSEMNLFKDDMNFQFDDLHKLIESKFSQSRPDLKESLTDILTIIGKRIEKGIDELDEKEFIIRNNMVANFIDDLQKALGKSKSTIYNYLNKLSKKGLLKRIRIKNGLGRPHYFYYLPKKQKNSGGK